MCPQIFLAAGISHATIINAARILLPSWCSYHRLKQLYCQNSNFGQCCILLNNFGKCYIVLDNFLCNILQHCPIYKFCIFLRKCYSIPNNSSVFKFVIVHSNFTILQHFATIVHSNFTILQHYSFKFYVFFGKILHYSRQFYQTIFKPEIYLLK